MSSVADLVAPGNLVQLGDEATIALGQEWVAAGRVELVESSPLQVVGKVAGDLVAEVRLNVVDDRLAWSCSQDQWFCAHCAAVARQIWLTAPERRT